MRVKDFIPNRAKTAIKKTLETHYIAANVIDGMLHKREIPVFTGIPTMLSFQEREFLFGLASNVVCFSNIVEIGNYKGGSTYFLAKGAEIPEAKVYSIDPFDLDIERQKEDEHHCFYLDALGRTPSQEEVFRNLQRKGVEHRVELIPGFSQDVARTWNKGLISLMFIDGNHAELEADFYAWKPHLSKKAVIAFHDTNFPEYGLENATRGLDNLVTENELCIVDGMHSITTARMAA